ncbi:opsin 8, group member a [Gadus morhua]|uniref:opsin 8, group member a n=1 Tax=Gadus morhua TaxID=8049 RepID=UPI0011B46D15|nr:opsin-5-like [Gadus morhua]
MEPKYTSKLSQNIDIGVGLYLVVIAILSVIGNTAVLVISARRSTQLKGPELLAVNLAVTDLGMALSMYPLSIASAFNHGWLGGDPSCLYYGLMGMVFSVASIMSLTVLGMVRYLVNGNPPETGNKFERKTILLVISGIWLYAGVWAVLPLLGWGSYGPEPFGLACSVDWIGYKRSLNHSSFIVTMALLCALIPCLLLLFAYSAIAWKLHRAYRSMRKGDFHYGNIERRITLMAVMITLGFILAWAPYVSVSAWSMFHPADQSGSLPPVISLLPCLFAKTATVYNPFIYCVFQRTLGKHLCCCCGGGGGGGPAIEINKWDNAPRNITGSVDLDLSGRWKQGG